MRARVQPGLSHVLPEIGVCGDGHPIRRHEQPAEEHREGESENAHHWHPSHQQNTRPIVPLEDVPCARYDAEECCCRVARLVGEKRFLLLTAIPAHPIAQLERGTNENTSGLTRQYLTQRPKHAPVDAGEGEAIADILNQHPRERHALSGT